MKLNYCIIVLLIIGTMSCKDKVKNALVASDKIAIDSIKLTDLNSKPVDMTQFHGKALFINFWATWCKPCLEEMPSIQNAIGVVKDEKIVFLFASDETTEEIEQFKNNHDYPFNYVRVENPGELNIMALPTTFIFNREGKLVFSEMGSRQWDKKPNIDLILEIIK